MAQSQGQKSQQSSKNPYTALPCLAASQFLKAKNSFGQSSLEIPESPRKYNAPGIVPCFQEFPVEASALGGALQMKLRFWGHGGKKRAGFVFLHARFWWRGRDGTQKCSVLLSKLAPKPPWFINPDGTEKSSEPLPLQEFRGRCELRGQK